MTCGYLGCGGSWREHRRLSVCVLVAKGLRSLAITLLQLLIRFDDNSAPLTLQRYLLQQRFNFKTKIAL